MTRHGAGSEPIPFPRRARNRPLSVPGRPAPPSISLPPHNLPAPATPFVGRYEQVNEVCALLLNENVRLLTLTGPGGVGKTRLALRVAEEVLPNFEDGAYFVALASLDDPGLVLTAIAQALDVKEGGSATIEDQLRARLRDKVLLLVLDNFEQVTGAAPRVMQVLADAPGVQVIVTSRVSLHLYGEHEYCVPSMDLPEGEADTPPTAEGLGHFEAVQLFVARAQEIRPDFRLTDANAPAVAEICRRLDGLPLALELAAARIRLFSPQALKSRLDKSLPLLTGGSRDLPARHETLRNAIGWSYNLLDGVEQLLFRRMSVFAGGCTLDAAIYLAADSALEAGESLDRLESLIDKNLLRQREQSDGEPRFWMLATIREYALEKLAEAGQKEETRQAHARFVLALAEQAKPHLRGAQQESWFSMLEREHDNFRAALTFLMGHEGSGGSDLKEGARLASTLSWFWYVRGHYTEGRKWLDMAVSALDRETQVGDEAASREDLSLRVDVLRSAGTLAYMQSDHEQAIELTKRSLEIARRVGDKLMMARALNNLGTVLDQQGDVKQALPFHEESLQIRRELGDRPGMALVMSNLALVVERQGDYARANSLCEESIDMAREAGDSTNLASYIYNRGRIAYRLGDLDRAEDALLESLALSREVGFKAGELWSLSELGMVLCDRGDIEKAKEILEHGMDLSKEAGDVTETSWILVGRARIALLKRDYEQARSLLQEALRLRLRLREFNISTVDTVDWLAIAELHAAHHEKGKERARRAAILFGATEARRKSAGAPMSQVWREQHAQALHEARTLLGRQAYSAAWAEGQALGFEDTIRLGVRELPVGGSITLAQPQLLQANPEDEHDLTSRELEVLRLIAAGLTNKEIGERLVVSPRTVQAHLYRIFGKLDVTTRSAATRYALERGLA